jgi:protein-tyrosine phosphatase
VSVDYNQVASRLYQGGAVDSAQPYSQFDAIVLCAQEHQPRLRRFKGVTIRAPFADTAYPTATERRIAIRAAREVAKRLHSGETVLVACWAGLNRSGLVVGLALRMATRRHPESIIRAIRNARSEKALSNPAFERIVRGFSAKTRSGTGRSRSRRRK